MTELRDWARLPSRWIENGGLKNFKWRRDGKGSANVAALMMLAVIAHHADQSGAATLTYDDLSDRLGGLSRAKISAGLKVLEAQQIIERAPKGRSIIKLTNYDVSPGWCKLPAKALYRDQKLTALSSFKLRSPTELHALMLYLLFATRRNAQINMALISYDKIIEYTGLNRAHIAAAISLLINSHLVHVHQVPSERQDGRSAHGYRLTHLDGYIHMGTRGRRDDLGDLMNLGGNDIPETEPVLDADIPF
jgi:DNA-binding transcriptional ArsR family regulator